MIESGRAAVSTDRRAGSGPISAGYDGAAGAGGGAALRRECEPVGGGMPRAWVHRHAQLQPVREDGGVCEGRGAAGGLQVLLRRGQRRRDKLRERGFGSMQLKIAPHATDQGTSLVIASICLRCVFQRHASSG